MFQEQDAGLFFDRSPTPSVMPPAAEARRHVGPGLLCGACGTRNPPGAGFCRACGTPLAVDSSLETRKTVTVLFCDVVASSALAERLDRRVAFSASITDRELYISIGNDTLTGAVTRLSLP